MALLRFNGNVVLLFILSLVRLFSLIYSHWFWFLCNLFVSFSLCLFIWTNIFKNLFVEWQRVACVPLYLFLSACLPACVCCTQMCMCVCHTFRKQKLYLGNTCVCGYANENQSSMLCTKRATPERYQLTLLEMLLDFDLCAVFMHVYKLIFNR